MNLPTHTDQRLRQAEDLLKLIQTQLKGYYDRHISIVDDPFAVADMLDEFHTRLGEYFDTHPAKLKEDLIQKL